MNAIEAALHLILTGVIEVRADGSVWKLRNLNTTPLDAPRRLETTAKNGYLAVRVNLNRKAYMMWAHRLVWTVLSGPIPEGLEINHKDGDPTNNHPSNLELVTPRENMLHSYRVLGRKLPRSVPMPVLARVAPEARALRAQGRTYAQIAKVLGVSQTTAFRAAAM